MSTLAAPLPPAVSAAPSRKQVVLRVRAASAPRRCAAALVDVLVLLATSGAATAAAALTFGVTFPRPAELGPDLLLAGLLDQHPMAVGALGLFAGLSALYLVLLGGLTGRSLGKRLFRLRVISVHGVAPGPLRSVGRFLALALAAAPAGIGWLWCLFDRERRGAHDHLAGTYVILDD